MKAPTGSVRVSLLVCFFGLLALLIVQFPKLGGVLSGPGRAIQEVRVTLLGAEGFKMPEHRVRGDWLVEKRDPLFYRHYRVCDTCDIPLRIATNDDRDTIRIMNIVPKYQYGMKLPSGDYDVEITDRRTKEKTRETVTLTRANNIFLYD